MNQFAGFSPEAFAFLKGLAANNEADWFKPRKAIYEAEIKAPLAALVADLVEGAQERGLPFTGDPARSVFRIYRDIRFSHDKRPYKTAASAALTRKGSKQDPGALYVHAEPGACFLGCGFWHAEPRLLDAWRKEMVQRPARFLAVVRALEKAGLEVTGGEIRKRLPRGFEDQSSSKIAPYLLWNSFVVYRKLKDRELQSPDLPDKVLGFGEACRPLLDYGWALVGASGGSAPRRRKRA
ncbi:TIGR02453 family protein [Rhizobiales bacterium GAS113]|nr:TIGR02453 family protein [Rhizobiales bacterium GAS113]